MGTPFSAAPRRVGRGAQRGRSRPGDLMLMYGSTMFLIALDATRRTLPGLWRTAGRPTQHETLAAGMATSGLLTTWLSDLTGLPIAELAAQAEADLPGRRMACGPSLLRRRAQPAVRSGRARSCFGLRLGHAPAHLMRATYEAIALGIRHNLQVFDAMAARPAHVPDWRLVAVGGGASSRPNLDPDRLRCHRAGAVRTRSDNRCQLRRRPAGRDRRGAGAAAGTDWTRISHEVTPRPELAELYQRRYDIYRELYPATRQLIAQL